MPNDRANRTGNATPVGETADQLRTLQSGVGAALRRLFSGSHHTATGRVISVEASNNEPALGTEQAAVMGIAQVTQQDFVVYDTQVSLLSNGVATAVAIDSLPTPKSAALALEAVADLSARFPLAMDGIVGVAFAGEHEPSNDTIDALENGCVYVALNNLKASAIDNAKAFLAEIESHVPEAHRIAMLGQATY